MDFDLETLRLMGLSSSGSGDALEELLKLPSLGYQSDFAESLLEGSGVDPELVVDLGCGTGAALIHMATRYGSKCVGVDISTELLTEARKRARGNGVDDHVHVVLADLRHSIPLVIRKGGFIIISSIGTLLGNRAETASRLSTLAATGCYLLWLDSHAWPYAIYRRNFETIMGDFDRALTSTSWQVLKLRLREHGRINMTNGPALFGCTVAVLARLAA